MSEKKYSAYFEYQGKASGEKRKKDFAWWQRVMVRAVKRSDMFRFECRQDDIEGLGICAKLGAAQMATMSVQGNREVWSGELSGEVIRQFMEQPFAISGELKWNSVLLKKGSKTIVACTHNGRQVGMHGVNELDLDFFARAVEGRNFSFFFWEDVPSGQTVNIQKIFSFDGDLNDIIAVIEKNTKRIK